MFIGGGTGNFKEIFRPYVENKMGLDIGFGGRSIINTAINIDQPQPYQEGCSDSQHLKGDARNLYWFKDACLDYVYSSHLLEDFEDKKPILIEWIRVLKSGGLLILLLPDQKRYVKEAEFLKVGLNHAHKDPNFSINTVKELLKDLPVVIDKEFEFYKMEGFSSDREYNFAVIVRKL
jgi:ubiquinone/menaquinone biosynthesis C-methylase UbiE